MPHDDGNRQRGTPEADPRPLRVANEAFLIASTIERCPKTMMLRELVMNALEAARDGQQPGRVVIDGSVVAGIPKLRIWNTGIGLSPDELDAICDIAATLRKQTGLDGNFGMGAKVASLPSNRHGLRYRSCKDGRVSEVTLGQRNGIYGRLAPPSGASLVGNVADVTASHAVDGASLANDWTQVELLGQSAQQDTTTDPYGGDPAVDPDWVMQTLLRRFYLLPDGLDLVVGQGIGAAQPRTFVPYSRTVPSFDRVETVETLAGIRVHYAFAADPAAVMGGGGGMIVFNGEIYDLVDGGRWLLDATVFGIPFGARFFRLVVELPGSFRVRPEGYRQFLRFRDGDQRQVHLADFAGLIRSHLPGWLIEIIESLSPAKADYLQEIGAELTALLETLGVPATSRAVRQIRGQDEPVAPIDEMPAASAPPATPRPARFEPPPTIIGLRDESQIDEKRLAGRAASYSAETHELFVNLTYPSVPAAQAELLAGFQALPDPDRARAASLDIAEAAITRLVARAVVYSLAKRAVGWSSEEIVRAQSPESLSLAADDYEAQVPLGRNRLAILLGLQLPGLAASGSAPERDMTAASRAIAVLAETRQAARRADSAEQAIPFIRRVSELEMGRRDLVAAEEWARRAVSLNADDPWSHRQLAVVLQRSGRLAEAKHHVIEGMRVAPPNTGSFEMLLSDIARDSGDLPEALIWTERAIGANPAAISLVLHLSYLHQQNRDLPSAWASFERALALQPNHPPVLRRAADLSLQMRRAAQAVDWAQRAVAADPADPDSHDILALVHQHNADHDQAATAIQAALALKPSKPARFLRRACDIALRTKRLEEAAVLAAEAVGADPSDPYSYHMQSQVLHQMGDLTGALGAARRGAEVATGSPQVFVRRVAEMLEANGSREEAIVTAMKALELEPREITSYEVLADIQRRGGDLDGAWQTVLGGLDVAEHSAPLLRRASDIALHRNGPETAIMWARRAVAANPSDPWMHVHLAGFLERTGQVEDALASVRQALRIEGVNLSAFRSYEQRLLDVAGAALATA